MDKSLVKGLVIGGLAAAAARTPAVANDGLPGRRVELLAEAKHHGSKHHDGGDFHDLLLLLAAPAWGRSA